MYRYSLARVIVLVLVAFTGIAAILGSGGGGGGGATSDAPVLSSVTFAPNSAAAGLTITIDGTFTFSDPNGNLNGGSFNYTYHGTTYSFPLPPQLAGITSGTVLFQLVAVLDSTTGTEPVPAWLVDNTGLSSNVFQLNFTQLWTRQFGTALEDVGNGIAIDSANNVVVVGTTLGNLDGQTNPGGASVFVTKYAPDTSRAWTSVFGSSTTDTGRAVARDGTDNVYVVGDTQGTSFDGVAADGSLNGFLTKLNSSGARQWTRVIGAAGSERAHGVATDSIGNIYVVGDTTADLDGEANAGNWDAFLIKFNSSGTRQWTRLLGSTGSDTAYGVTVDAGGNVYLTGASDGTLGGSVNADVFVAKYDSDGNQSWLTPLATSCTEWANGIALGAGGNLYVAGMIISPCAFAGNTAMGLRDAFVAQLNASGVVQWVRQFGTSNYDTATGVTSDSAGNAYVTGFLNSVSFNDDNEGHFVFLAKYDSAGNQAWVAQDDAGSSWGNQGRAAATDSNSNIFLTGMVHGRLDGHTNPFPGEDDVFILKYDSGGTRR